MTNKQTVHFDIEYFRGSSIVGCSMISDLAIELEFTKQQIEFMRKLVGQVDEELYSEGIMPVLKDGAPELYNRMENAARNEIFDFLVADGIRQGFIEFEDDELRANFRKDFGIGDDEEIDDNSYYLWYDEEMSRISCSGLAWIRARYSVDDQVSMDVTPDYTVDIPVDFLP